MAFLLRTASRRISGAIRTSFTLSQTCANHHSDIREPQCKYPLQMGTNPQHSTARVRNPWPPAGYFRSYATQSDPESKQEEATVERDTSSVANELRGEFEGLRKAAYDLSRGLLLVGIAHLTCGVWIHWITKPSLFSEVSVQSYIAFAFPLTMALMVRRMLKPISFFSILEERGRLHILTLALQVTRGVKALFRRIQAVAVICAAAISICLLANAYPT